MIGQGPLVDSTVSGCFELSVCVCVGFVWGGRCVSGSHTQVSYKSAPSTNPLCLLLAYYGSLTRS